ncbi:GntR family transcriptional regulator, partial [Burkholderia vietnamiensis]|uniref:GntR family transcriptional regulator n=1 Tax=Burkholderia vietnamiensis TaxID=60552 RepID=UPI0015946484
MSPRITPPALQLVESETMADKVYQQLREALMSGRFAPGQALSLRGVAEAVGSSTMPVRAALTRLAADRALCETMHTHAEAGDTREYLRANFALHRAIYRHGASESTLAIIENLWMRIGP